MSGSILLELQTSPLTWQAEASLSAVSGKRLQLGGINKPVFKWGDSEVTLLCFRQWFPLRAFTSPTLCTMLPYHSWSTHILYKVLNYSDLKDVSVPDQQHWEALNQSHFEHGWVRNAERGEQLDGPCLWALLLMLRPAVASMCRQHCMPVQTSEQTASHLCYLKLSYDYMCFF